MDDMESMIQSLQKQNAELEAEMDKKIAEHKAELDKKIAEHKAELDILQNGKKNTGEQLGVFAEPALKGSSITETDLAKRLPKEKRNERGGALLTHWFYRDLIKQLHTKTKSVDAESSNEFSKLLELCTGAQDSRIGLTKMKNKGATSCCPEPVTTAILAPLINAEIRKVWEEETSANADLKEKPPRPVWCSEIELRHDDSAKKPRLDGVLALESFLPSDGVGLRGVVCAEHKNNDFEEKGEWEALGNGMDLFALKEAKNSVWPVVVMQVSFISMSVRLIALVPDSTNTFASSRLWKGKGINDYIFCLHALARSLHGFYCNSISIGENKVLQFGPFLKNIAYDKQAKKYYKWFHNSIERRDNIRLVQKFTHKDAIAVCDTNEKTIFIEIPAVGDAGTGSCSSSSFSTIANALNKLHTEDKCGHGDIRHANLVLKGTESRMLDFDYAGALGTRTYPSTLAPIDDGERHEEIRKSSDLANLFLKAEHDWFSLAAVMKLFKATDESSQKKWAAYTEQILKGDYSVAIEELSLALIKKNGEGEDKGGRLKASGSPPEKRKGPMKAHLE